MTILLQFFAECNGERVLNFGQHLANYGQELCWWRGVAVTHCVHSTKFLSTF